MRFESATDSAGDLLPGMLFAALRHRFDRSTALPFGLLPKALRERDANLRYQPSHKLEGHALSVLVGQRMAAVSFTRPYGGWAVVKPQILECFEKLLETSFVQKVERVSLKYVNLLSDGVDKFDLSQLRLKVQLGDLNINPKGFMLQAEVEKNDCVTIVHAAGGASVGVNQLGKPTASGVLLTVDTLKLGPFGERFRAELPGILDVIHSTEKEIFVQCVAPETLEKLGPKWSD